MKKGLKRSVAEIDSDLAYNASRGAVRFGKDIMWVPKGMMGALKGDGPNPQAVFCAYGLILCVVLPFTLLRNPRISGNCVRNTLFSLLLDITVRLFAKL